MGDRSASFEAFFGERDGGPWLLWSGWPTPDLSYLGYVLWGHPPIMVRPPGGGMPPDAMAIGGARWQCRGACGKRTGA